MQQHTEGSTDDDRPRARAADAIAPAWPDPVCPDVAALLRRMAAGDEASLAALYDAYAPVLYAVALRIVDAPAEADEVVLDAFTQAWREARRFDPASGSGLAWLVRLCRARALAH